MFGHRYFGGHMFGPVYFGPVPDGGGGEEPPPSPSWSHASGGILSVGRLMCRAIPLLLLFA